MSRFRRSAAWFVALAAVSSLPALARAQDHGRGFLFGAPVGSFTLSAGWAGASAGSDLFSFTTNQLTLNKSDFSSPTLGADLAFHVLPRTEVVLSASLSGMDRKSRFRGYEDNNNLPIEQTTSFRRVPTTLNLKQYLASPGREIGRFAWIPARFAPYVGAGGGVTYYRFKQTGDFIDFNTLDVFNDTYMSDGWARTADVLAGFDYSLNSRFALTTEGRYTRSSAVLSPDFSGFHNIDLSGFATTVGLTVRF